MEADALLNGDPATAAKAEHAGDGLQHHLYSHNNETSSSRQRTRAR